LTELANMRVEILEHFGNDLMVVNAARVSYGKNKKTFDLNDEKLIKYLVEHKHTSVFRHPQLQFRITFPIFVERQVFKHQVGISVNSISGRYVDFSDTYYMITQFRNQSKSSKQGSEGFLLPEDNAKAEGIYNHVIRTCQRSYKELLELGVSKEQARAVLPLALESQCIWTGSMLAFLHLCNLRLKPDAQQETRELVYAMLESVKQLPGNPFEFTLKAFNL
jgi:thymidylate synthase (FAD)